MARISEVIHVKGTDGVVQECALFSASSDIPSPASAREFALNGARIYGAVISGNPGSDDGNWVFGNNSTPLEFVPDPNNPLDFTALLTTPYFVRPLVDSISVGADGATFAWGDLLSTNGSVVSYGTPDTGYVTTSGSGVTVSANTVTAARSFTVGVTVRFADGSTQDITFSGTQAGAASASPLLTLTSESTVPNVAALSSVWVTFTVNSDTTSVRVTCSEWSHDSSGNGVSLMSLEGTGTNHADDFEQEVTPGSSYRMEVTIAGGGLSDEVEITLRPYNGSTAGTTRHVYLQKP